MRYDIKANPSIVESFRKMVANNEVSKVHSFCTKSFNRVAPHKYKMYEMYLRYADSKRNHDQEDNELIVNHEYLISTMKSSYLLGKPIKYTQENPSLGLDALTKHMEEYNYHSTDFKVALHSAICGVWYDLLYVDSNTNTVKVSDLNGINVCYIVSEEVEHKPLMAIVKSKTYNAETGKETEIYTIYDDKYVVSFNQSNKDEQLTKKEHKFDRLPINQYLNNFEGRGTFENVIGLIDKLNDLLDNSIKDKEKFVDNILVAFGVNLNELDAVNNMGTTGILSGLPEDARIDWLNKVMNESDVSVLRKELNDQIYNIAMIPNLASATESGASGLALRQNFTPLEIQLSITESLFKPSIRNRVDTILHYWVDNLINSEQVKSGIVDEVVSIQFTRNLPTNILELTQMISTLTGGKSVLSRESAVGLLPMIDDVKSELNRLDSDEEQSSMKDYSFGLNKPLDNNLEHQDETQVRSNPISEVTPFSNQDKATEQYAGRVQ